MAVSWRSFAKAGSEFVVLVEVGTLCVGPLDKRSLTTTSNNPQGMEPQALAGTTRLTVCVPAKSVAHVVQKETGEHTAQ